MNLKFQGRDAAVALASVEVPIYENVFFEYAPSGGEVRALLAHPWDIPEPCVFSSSAREPLVYFVAWAFGTRAQIMKLSEEPVNGKGLAFPEIADELTRCAINPDSGEVEFLFLEPQKVIDYAYKCKLDEIIKNPNLRRIE